MKLKDINKKHLIIGLIVIAGLIGVQYMAVFGSSTGIYSIDKSSYEASIGDTIIITGKAWIDSPGGYEINGWTPSWGTISRLDIITALSSGTWYFEAPIKITEYGSYKIHLSYSDRDSSIGADKYITVSAPGAPYEPGDEPPVEDSCSGVSCNDYCVGTTLYRDGHCVDGTCKYSKDYKSEDCGYVPPVVDPCIGVSCGDKCVGTTLHHSGYCEGGSCQYEQTAQSEQCGYVGEPVDTDDDDVLTTIMLIMVFVLVLLGGTYMYIKR